MSSASLLTFLILTVTATVTSATYNYSINGTIPSTACLMARLSNVQSGGHLVTEIVLLLNLPIIRQPSCCSRWVRQHTVERDKLGKLVFGQSRGMAPTLWSDNNCNASTYYGQWQLEACLGPKSSDGMYVLHFRASVQSLPQMHQRKYWRCSVCKSGSRSPIGPRGSPSRISQT